MVNKSNNNSFSVYVGGKLDKEMELVNHLVQTTTQAGICEDPASVINFYVALKSKPMLILAGPVESGKTAFVQCLARLLTGGNCLQYQTLVGHPWFAGGRHNVAFLTGIHERFNSEKLLCIIEEAQEVENREQVFMVSLDRISPAELVNYFTEISLQLCRGRVIRFGDVHLSYHLPYPNNLFLIGTMDTKRFTWWNNDLISNTTVILWPEIELKTPQRPVASAPIQFNQINQNAFLQVCIRNKQEAYRKLHNVLNGQRQPLYLLLQLQAVLDQYKIFLPSTAIDEIVIYLANSWSSQGYGLFDPLARHNLMIALDLSIKQIILPRIPTEKLHMLFTNSNLKKTIYKQFPRSAMFIENKAR